MRFCKYFTLGLFLTIGVGLILSENTNAVDEFSWLTDAAVEVSPYIEAAGCSETIELVDYERPGIPSYDTYHNACISKAKGFYIATYTNKYQRYELAIKFDDDTQYRLIRGMDKQMDVKVIPESSKLIFKDYAGLYATTLTTIDVADALRVDERNAAGSILSYMLDSQKNRHWFDYIDESGQERYLRVFSYAVSANGRYIFSQASEIGHVKVDLLDDQATLVTHLRYGGYMNIGAGNAVAINDDGRYGFINSPITVVDMNACGLILTPQVIYQKILNPAQNDFCLYRNDTYNSIIFEKIGYNGYGLDYEWLDAGHTLRFTVSPLPGTGDAINSKPWTVVLRFHQKSSLASLDYLALGDSYSSGEGDIGKQENGQPFYTSNTIEDCHLSTRSYPFLLRSFLDIPADRMQSVACSGARLNKDYFSDDASYYGQHDQTIAMLKNMPELERNRARENALVNFDPGIIKQIDFVKKNKPRTITFTGGGNDVGFASILRYCASPTIGGIARNTCSMAIPNSKAASILADAIRGQYQKTINFIDAVKQISPNTAIHVVGYPSFVATSRVCVNGAALNVSERIMINQSVAYLNNILRSAAARAGANFIDVENSLVGGRICEGSEYMTGILNVVGPEYSKAAGQMFHPNSRGHEKIANKIYHSGFRMDNINPTPDMTSSIPEKPRFFRDRDYIPTQRTDMVDSAVTTRGELSLHSGSNLLKPGSHAAVTLYSLPKPLGRVTVEADGSLNKKIILPKIITPGVYILLVEGRNDTELPVRYYQIIDVRSTIKADMDADGVKDTQDRCFTVLAWYDEMTKQNMCSVTKNR